MGGLHVPIDRIVPLTDARDNFSRIVAEIENHSEGLYVLTKGGKPSIALISIQYLEDLIDGRKTTALTSYSKSVEEKPEKDLEKPKSEDKPKKETPIKEERPLPPIMKSSVTDKPIVPTTDNAPKINQTPPPLPDLSASSMPVKEDKPTINPTWIGSDVNKNTSASPTSVASATPKPVNPWPIIEPKTTPAPAETTSNLPKPSSPPPSAPASNPNPTPAVNSVQTEPPKQTPPLPPISGQTSTASVQAEGPVKINSNQTPAQTPVKDLPPPPATPPAIPFDEPPKIDSEPGEKAPVDKAAPPPPPSASPAPSSPSNSSAKSTPITSVADLDI